MYTFQKSTRKNKKYMIEYNGVIIHFGDKRYEQFEDKALGLYIKIKTIMTKNVESLIEKEQKE